MKISQSELMEEVHYSPLSGYFYRLKSGKGKRVGDRCEVMHPSGYVRIMVLGKRYPAHHLAWLYVNGSFPKDQIDHINGNRSDNRIENLRECSCKENHQNRKSKSGSKSKYLGVSWVGARSKWVANIKCGKEKKQIGYFDSEGGAYEAYMKEKKSMHKFNPIPR